MTAWCDGGSTTNVPLDELLGRRGWVGYEYAGEPLAPGHGAPARLLVPHLYGDPWREQRYWGD